MKKKTILTSEQIRALSYTSFIGLINQWNVPPGAYDTLSRWEIFGKMDSGSSILEIACTTGFSSRELSLATNCSGVGIDISEESILAAKANQRKYGDPSKVQYLALDALEYNSNKKFSHLILGAALRFFPDPEQALEYFMTFLKPEGYILSCEFYCTKEIPKNLVDKAKQVFGITVTQNSYKEVMSVYKNLSLIYEDRKVPFEETEDELDHYCRSTVNKFSEENPGYPEQTLSIIRDRLYEIKKMSNDLRPFQGYNVLVHKKDSRIYPNRLTEIF